MPPGIRSKDDWIGFRISGVLDFSETGVLSEITGRLAVSAVPVFVLSTFDTDYFFVRAPEIEPARAALIAAGHSVLDQKP